jgi:hypothetical protein
MLRWRIVVFSPCRLHADLRRVALLFLLFNRRRRRLKRTPCPDPKLRDGILVFLAKSEVEFQLLFRLPKTVFDRVARGIRHRVEVYRF